jgi:hypothetical protein
VTNQVVALAEAIPAEKYAWRPAPDVRCTSQVFMHIAIANFSLVSITGPKMPADLTFKMEDTVTAKPEVIAWLKRSFDAVKRARTDLKPSDLSRKVVVNGGDASAFIFGSSCMPTSTWGS